METNILGLPSLTGYTPLKAAQEGQVLKYDFKGIGPIAVDKSGHGNLGRLKPVDDPPRRKIRSLLPLKVVMVFDGENDYIEVPDKPTLNMGMEDLTVSLKVRTGTRKNYVGLIQKQDSMWQEGWGIAMYDGKITPNINNGSDKIRGMSRSRINDGEPHLVRVVYDRNGDMTIYIDEEEDGSSDISRFSGDNITNDHPVWIGRNKGQPRYEGEYNTVRVYNRIKE